MRTCALLAVACCVLSCISTAAAQPAAKGPFAPGSPATGPAGQEPSTQEADDDCDDPDTCNDWGSRCEIGEDTDGWLGRCNAFRHELDKKYGTRIGAVASYQGQLALDGPRREGKGKSAFSYELNVEQDIWAGGMIFAQAEGGSGRGIDSVFPTLGGLNGDAGEEDCIRLDELYLQQSALDRRLQLAVGKLDLSNFFDLNAAANCENSQFLAPSLINNPTIPFPEAGLGAVVKASPSRLWYVQAGVADAQAEANETGLNTAFHGRDDSFSIFEAGLSPRLAGRQGNYRAIFWYDPQPTERIDGRGLVRDDSGVAFSLDQEVTGRVTLFARYGLAHETVRQVEHFWSVGGQLAGPFESRKDDVAGLGVGQAITGADFRRASGASPRETIMEAYYKIVLCENLEITPNMQVILDPAASTASGGDSADAGVVAGVRMVLRF